MSVRGDEFMARNEYIFLFQKFGKGRDNLMVLSIRFRRT